MALGLFNVKKKMACFKQELNNLRKNRMGVIYEEEENSISEKCLTLNDLIDLYEISEGDSDISRTSNTSDNVSDVSLMSSDTDDLLASIGDDLLREWGCWSVEYQDSAYSWSSDALQIHLDGDSVSYSEEDNSTDGEGSDVSLASEGKADVSSVVDISNVEISTPVERVLRSRR